jgi:hypothetical protein
MATFDMEKEEPIITFREPTPDELAVAEEAKDTFQELLSLKQQIDSLEETYKSKSKQAIQAFQKYSVTRVSTDIAHYTLVTPARKKYGEDIIIMEEELKLAKEEADKKGDFTTKPSTPYLKITTK